MGKIDYYPFDAMHIAAATLVSSVLLVAPLLAAEGVGVDKGLQLKINRAISRGTDFLLEQDLEANPFTANTYPLGESCLVFYALAVSGVSPHHETMRELSRTAVTASRQSHQTYTLALALLGLLATDRVEHGAVIAHLVSRLELGQVRQSTVPDAVGAWSYTLPAGPTITAPESVVVAHWNVPNNWWDDSNTQYAILALRAAADFGFDVDQGVFERAAEHCLLRQNRDGGFGYTPTHRPDSYVAMTAGGLGSLLMCMELVSDSSHGKKLQRSADRVLRGGTSWLSRKLRFPAEGGPWPFYTAYSVERLGHYASIEKFGRHDWYAEGASWLTSIQRGDGSWSANRLYSDRRNRDVNLVDVGSTIDTSFALLFLRRASFVHTQRSDEVAALLKNLDPQISQSALEPIKKRILAGGEHAIPQLVKGLYLPKRIARELAAECLQELTGENYGFLGANDEEEMRRAREQWVRYLLQRRQESRGG